MAKKGKPLPAMLTYETSKLNKTKEIESELDLFAGK